MKLIQIIKNEVNQDQKREGMYVREWFFLIILTNKIQTQKYLDF